MTDVREVTDQTFDAEVLQAAMPVLVDFWAPWCGPCKMLRPIVAEIAGEYRGKLKVAAVNVDENPAVSQRHGVTSIPTLLVFSGGAILHTIIGAKPKPLLVAELEPFLSST